MERDISPSENWIFLSVKYPDKKTCILTKYIVYIDTFKVNLPFVSIGTLLSSNFIKLRASARLFVVMLGYSAEINVSKLIKLMMKDLLCYNYISRNK